MDKMFFARKNGRVFPEEDKIFALNARAKAMAGSKGKDKVVNAVIGALLDEDGKLIVLDSVMNAIHRLAPSDFAEYAPIRGTEVFMEAVQKSLFGSFETARYVEVVSTMGGTGAVRNTVSNYSCPGDKILTSDWYWNPYGTIAAELGRSIDTYELFDADGVFNTDSLKKKVNEILGKQESLILILNTPAHNPTGYSLNDDDWERLVNILEQASGDEKKITLLVDAAYIDFAGTFEESRSFLPWLEKLGNNVLPLIAYSASKGFTLYGMRCGALVCMAPNRDIADEFRKVSEFASRGTWSNGVRAAQTVLANICNDLELYEGAVNEREHYRNMLEDRGKRFEKALNACGVNNVPFKAGFFTCIESPDPVRLSSELEQKGIFVAPLKKGIRISLASVPGNKCSETAKEIAKTIQGKK